MKVQKTVQTVPAMAVVPHHELYFIVPMEVQKTVQTGPALAVVPFIGPFCDYPTWDIIILISSGRGVKKRGKSSLGWAPAPARPEAPPRPSSNVSRFSPKSDKSRGEALSCVPRLSLVWWCSLLCGAALSLELASLAGLADKRSASHN